MRALDAAVVSLIALSAALVGLDGLVRPAAIGVFLATATLTFYGLRRIWQTPPTRRPTCDEIEAAPR